MVKNELKKRINEMGLTPRKPLGQNFLASEKIAKRIVQSSEVKSEDLVVELGPGLGIITKKIIEKGAQIVVIEIDKKLSSYLKNRFYNNPNFHIITDDFFNLEMDRFSHYKIAGDKIFISNLPYRGAKKILKNLCRSSIFSTIVITIQKEIAEKILTGPENNEATALTYYINFLYKPQKLFDIPMNFFFPVPAVNSTTIKLILKKQRLEQRNEKFVYNTIDILLKNKKKKIRNNIKSCFHIPYERIDSILKSCGLDKDIRPTELSIKKLIKLSKKLKKEI